MSTVNMYDLSPALQLMGVGIGVATVPLGYWLWRHRQANAMGRLQALAFITLFLTFDLVLFGAFTRLTDSGLGCPDWPGCYGKATPLGASEHILAAQSVLPSGPVTPQKAWIEMVHRYLASGVGVLIFSLLVLTWHLRKQNKALSLVWPLTSLFWVCVQGAFGALTVTMKLFPLMVTLHLLFGIGLLLLLLIQALSYATPKYTEIPALWRRGLWCGLVLLLMQVALGAWVSTNYAVLACPDFPTCHGQWLPKLDMQGFDLWRSLGHTANGELLPLSALSTIHYAHRSAAWLVLGVLITLGWRMRTWPDFKNTGYALLMLCALQLGTGVSNVVFNWPLLAAVLHTGGAAALALVLVWALQHSRQSQASLQKNKKGQ